MRALILAALFALALAPMAHAQDVLPLWPHDPPGPRVANTPENVRITEQGEHVVSGIRRPSLTVYLPAAGTETGAAIIIAPGGGHRELWIDHEGHRVAQFFAEHGVAAFVLKYRLANEEGSPYTVEGDELGDMQRAVRVVRARAAAWRVQPEAVGVMGFSAGGQVAALTAWRDGAGDPNARDPVDRQSAKPSFAALIYPGIPTHDTFSAETPPMFLLAGSEDRPAISEGLAELYLELKRSGASAELHILAGAPHGFGLRESNPPAIAAWPTTLLNWINARGFLSPQAH